MIVYQSIHDWIACIHHNVKHIERQMLGDKSNFEYYTIHLVKINGLCCKYCALD